MADLGSLRGNVFQPHIGDTFMVEGVNGQLPLTLVDVWIGQRPIFDHLERLPFTLTFRCDYVVNIRAHELFNLRHATLGLIEGIFIGPVSIVPKPHWGKGAMFWSADFN